MRLTVVLGLFLAGCAASPGADVDSSGDSSTGPAMAEGSTMAAGSTGEDSTSVDATSGSSSGGADDSTSGPMGTTNAGDSSGDSGDTGGTGEGSSTGAAVGPDEGSLSVLTYNVAGLPDLISGSDPLVNTPLISPLLNDFDLVLVQEDFSYHAELSADAEHPYQSTPGGGGTVGDGLNRFSGTVFSDFERAGWEQCNGLFDSGSDCLTAKGFSVGLHELGPDAGVDVYNLHMDAGGSQGDIEARQAQIQQLLETIALRSNDRALIVAGDTNMDEEDEADFVTLLEGAGLVDACRELDCGEEYRIDRIMLRSSDTVELVPTLWLVDDTFVDGSGDPLSDHEAVVVELDWSTL